MDYICKRNNNIQSISITADCTGPRDKEGSQQNPNAPPLSPNPWLEPEACGRACLGPTHSVWPGESVAGSWISSSHFTSHKHKAKTYFELKKGYHVGTVHMVLTVKWERKLFMFWFFFPV